MDYLEWYLPYLFLLEWFLKVELPILKIFFLTNQWVSLNLSLSFYIFVIGSWISLPFWVWKFLDGVEQLLRNRVDHIHHSPWWGQIMGLMVILLQNLYSLWYLDLGHSLEAWSIYSQLHWLSRDSAMTLDWTWCKPSWLVELHVRQDFWVLGPKLGTWILEFKGLASVIWGSTCLGKYYQLQWRICFGKWFFRKSIVSWAHLRHDPHPDRP